ncbi:hypothetical protein D1818_19780 [Aquimarina sp. BL5]|uniref:hypothetical protein n=1 Tax=Aquimarina sp. BL5 TaxID=1714860 RepID=UPI000E472A21|nr:hypothetical protein [Aquimarina sp. BL5]AXT52950.1 hypothetical protein D1818_19780 [Aquimarina sp. BL5]RKN10362.1 hypothetical protein D7036_02585 [Aquimarina sp. BL5]
MKTKKTYALLLFVGAILITASCVKELDFEQLDDVVLTPVFEADFIYSEFDVEDNIPQGTPPNTEFTIPPEVLRDTINYDLVGTDFAIDNLDRVELTMEVRNTIPAAFTIQFQFLTQAGQPIGQLYSIPVQAGLGEGTEPVISFSDPNPIVLDNATLNQLASAQKIATEIIVPTLNSDLRGALQIRSKASYYVNYQL